MNKYGKVQSIVIKFSPLTEKSKKVRKEREKKLLKKIKNWSG